MEIPSHQPESSPELSPFLAELERQAAELFGDGVLYTYKNDKMMASITLRDAFPICGSLMEEAGIESALQTLEEWRTRAIRLEKDHPELYAKTLQAGVIIVNRYAPAAVAETA